MRNTKFKLLRYFCFWIAAFIMGHYGFSQTTLNPTDDSYAHMSANDRNWGSDTLLYSIKNSAGTEELQIYLKFDVSGITEPVESAILRLFVIEGPSEDYRKVMTVSNDSWDEMTITWDNKPATGDSIGYLVPNTIGHWVEVEIGDYVEQQKSDGYVSLALIPKTSDGWLRFKSRQAVVNPPELVINRPNPYGVFFDENFGSGDYFDGEANQFANYSSDAVFSTDLIRIQNFSQSDYEGASGGNFLWLGRVTTDPPVVDRPTITFSGINTTGRKNALLSLGHTTWAQTANEFLDIYYSIDGTNFTKIDNDLIYAGSWAPTNAWGVVTLGTPLPQTENLYLKFENLNTNQSVRIDDIKITNLETDNIPPSVPENLSAQNLTPWSFILSWEESTDNSQVNYYEISVDGSVIGVTTENYYGISGQTPGSSPDFTVVAYDDSENASAPSAALNVTFPEDETGEGRPVVWDEDQANVLPGGDLSWNPKPLAYNPGTSVRYIDYDNGDDNADGQSQSTAWKHHPWDSNATSNAASESGIHTYVFKKGVVYRGSLVGNESGTPFEKIQLTVDPTWGTGKAMFYGSQRIDGGWTQGDASSAPGIPEPEKVYYIDLSSELPETKTVVEINGNEMKRINLARSPNWQITDSIFPMEHWWKWTGVQGNESQTGKLIDETNLTQTDPSYWVGGTVWSEWQGTMGSVWGQEIQSYNPETNSVTTPYIYGGTGKRYYIENLPQLLDSSMEYWFDKSGDFPGRLYVRLSEDRDPNNTIIEVAVKNRLIDISNQNFISISGLNFAFTTSTRIHYGDGAAKDVDAIINLDGYSHDIEIANCSFTHVNAGIAVENTTDPALNVNNIVVADNLLKHVSDQPITFSSGGGKYMDDIFILRNKIYENGFRQLNRWYSAIPSIAAYLKTGVVAGNFIDQSWGAGVYLHWGKGTDDASRSIPFIRGFVYQNRVENTLLGTSDWGGIEHWQGGPAYYYNNYSKNAHGWQGSTQNNTWNPWGFPFYFDGSFKLYAFNNIAVSPFNSTTDPRQRNRAGYQMVLGSLDMLANNTSHNFYNGIISQGYGAGVPAYNAYLGNILSKTSRCYFSQKNTPSSLIPFDSYANNIFSGTANVFWEYNGGTAYSVDAFSEKLEELNAQSGQLGWEASYDVIPGADDNNFLPSATGEAIDRGVKFFAPFALKAVVGEWHFYKHAADSSLVAGENFYMTAEYEQRDMYYNIPKNHLNVQNVKYADYVKGSLEDWTEGALQFDGESTFGTISNSSEQQQLITNDLDMTTSNFIIEVYLKTTAGHANSTIVSKFNDGSNGYRLGINGSGQPVMELITGGSVSASAAGSSSITDEGWHHILAEVTRNAGINIYVDGELSSGAMSGGMPDEALSLENIADFYIGKDESGNFFNGTIDFVRISKGNLTDAKTTIDELYKWQFDGPFLYDFAGNAPIGKRDAGALEAGEKLCNLILSPGFLDFEVPGGSEQISVTGSFELIENQVDFVTAGLVSEGIEVTVPQNPSLEPRSVKIEIFGCNETVQIPVNQKGQPTNIEEPSVAYNIFPNPVKDVLFIEHNFTDAIDLSIIDINGRLILEKENISQQEVINISGLSRGFYYVKIKSTDGIKTHKVVVK